MQLSAANLLLAAQQQAAARQAPQPKPPAFAAALAVEAKAKDALFAPLDFKQTAPAQAPAQPQGPAPRIGSSLDIRV